MKRCCKAQVHITILQNFDAVLKSTFLAAGGREMEIGLSLKGREAGFFWLVAATQQKRETEVSRPK